MRRQSMAKRGMPIMAGMISSGPQDPPDGAINEADESAAGVSGQEAVAERHGQAQADADGDHQVDAEPDDCRVGADHGRDDGQHPHHGHEDAEDDPAGDAADRAGDGTSADARAGACDVK